MQEERREVKIPMFPEKILKCLELPGSEGGAFDQQDGKLVSADTGKSFPFVDGIPSLFIPSSGDGAEISERVKSFYEENPFPSYEGLEEFGDLVNKGSKNSFSAKLLDAIGYNKIILECGCGTGQLSHFLQLNNNSVLGIDMSLSSLRLAIEHKFRNQLARSCFAQMNIFNLALKDNSFDVVISHGVLHHTFDARRAFSHIVRKVKPGGIVMIGLYNRYARIPTYLRSKLIGVLGPNIDYVVRNRIHDKNKADIWIKDQYYNPHETWHSIGEVLDWFAENDVEFLNANPAILNTDGETAPSLFSKTSSGNSYKRVITQLGWISSIAREGALFEIIGRLKY